MILYINTSAEYCETALFYPDKKIDHLIHEEALKHSQVLHGQLAQLLKSKQLSYNDISAVAVMNGPGSYTGLRVGLAAAKSICYASNKPLILLNKLQCIAQKHAQLNDLVATMAILPARKDEYFAHTFNSVENINESKSIFLDEIEDHLSSNDIDIVTLTNVNYPEYMSVHRTSLELIDVYSFATKMLEKQAFSDLYAAEPFYFKAVHANKAKPKF
jgi:tRNA threonylcarbamoyladenosine biosynthesis protein TsaB